MLTFLFVLTVISYCQIDLQRLNKELQNRIHKYPNIDKKIIKKPPCKIYKTVFLFIGIIAVIAVITVCSETTAVAAMFIAIIIYSKKRKKKVKQIYMLDKDNSDYWR